MASPLRAATRVILEPPYVFAKNVYNLAGGNKNPSISASISVAVTTATILGGLILLDLGISAIDAFISNNYSRLTKKLADILNPSSIVCTAALPIGYGYSAKVIVDSCMREKK
jgi:hypothetical protein